MFLTKKIQTKETNTTFLKHFLNAMIKNSKIHKILDIIETPKSMEPNKFTFLRNYELYF